MLNVNPQEDAKCQQDQVEGVHCQKDRTPELENIKLAPASILSCSGEVHFYWHCEQYDKQTNMQFITAVN